MPALTLVAPGLYRHENGRYYIRPTIKGRRTHRALKAATLRGAKAEAAALLTDAARAAHGLALDPFRPESPTVADLAAAWRDAGCPTHNNQPRSGDNLTRHEQFLERLLAWWGPKQAEHITTADLGRYAAARKAEVKRGHGGRAIDLELAVLSNVLDWALQHGRLVSNPIAGRRPRYRLQQVTHCRDRMPIDAWELHRLAARLFDDKRSESLGWQVLLEAMTGCRTSEVLRWRWDASHRGQPGFIEGDWLWLARSKGGVNPFVHIHPALRRCLGALRLWHQHRQVESPYFVPGRGRRGVASPKALTHALRLVSPLMAGAHRTSHGLRAYYVTVRRSQGIGDAQIASEIGDKSGAALIVSTYGAIPPNWHGSDALGWLPEDRVIEGQVVRGVPAWEVFEWPQNVVSLHCNGTNTGTRA